METTYTKKEVMQMVTDRLRLWSYGNPHAKFPSDQDLEIIGMVDLSIPEDRTNYFALLYEDQPLGIGA